MEKKFAVISLDSTDEFGDAEQNGNPHFVEFKETEEEANELYDELVDLLSNVYLVEIKKQSENI